ncbi:uncharacterized protein LOC143692179 [Agelaius phoeniceus]|uniref:uncharacterized protein LOC143692179 n=1 Tax=Agelaius phoeniceus TaxID=39638 RepID=UPI0040552212
MQAGSSPASPAGMPAGSAQPERRRDAALGPLVGVRGDPQRGACAHAPGATWDRSSSSHINPGSPFGRCGWYESLRSSPTLSSLRLQQNTISTFSERRCSHS